MTRNNFQSTLAQGSDSRMQQLVDWLLTIFPSHKLQLEPLLGDAGFRRYFRLFVQAHEHNLTIQKANSFIAVDAPVKTSNNKQFVRVQQALKQQNIAVPEIIASDLNNGFLCLTDLGSVSLSQVINQDNMAHYYEQALFISEQMSVNSLQLTDNIPLYDRDFVLMELAIFTQWLLEKHLNIALTPQEKLAFQSCFEIIATVIEQQPKVFMHRDFHSRNIMLHNQQLAVIDFQDAVKGPIVYDAVSLLKDCYVKWPAADISPLFEQHCQRLASRHQLHSVSQQQWHYWFDVTGLQRHLKAAGIFARLNHRDGKSHYLHDLPLTLHYIVETCDQYEAFQFIGDFIKQRVLPEIGELS